MSKKLIAGAGVVASMAVALAPMATFATPQTNPRGITDTLSVTIEEVCSFGYAPGGTTVISLGSHADGTPLSGNISGTQANTPENGKTAGMSYGKWDSTTLTAYDIPETGDPTKSGETAYAVMEAGTNNPAFASTTMNIVCNNVDGYTLTATPSALTGTNGSIAASGYGDSVTTSTWGYKFAAATGSSNENTLTNAAQTWNANANAQQVITLDASDHSNPTKATGDSFTVTYGVSVATTLPADTYEGSIDYLLAEI